MTTILLATENGLGVATQADGRWQGHLALRDQDCQCVAVDPHGSRRAYCGAYDAGLWVSENGGLDWRPTAALPSQHVMAVAISPLVESEGLGLLWAGTEPSRLFVSADGGATWREQEGLQQIPSKPTWRFPPRPWTHHVRWIEPDATDANLIYVGIELGGVMRSLDGGKSWEDRKPNSQHDCHTLRAHSGAPGLIYEAAGGGFAMSTDRGASWERPMTGMAHHYVYGLAVDSSDAHTLIASAAPGARQAHSMRSGDSHLYRHSSNGAEDDDGQSFWQEVRKGLPEPTGTRVYILAADPTRSGTFYAATGSALYRSVDSGCSWSHLEFAWPEGWHSEGANALAVLP